MNIRARNSNRDLPYWYMARLDGKWVVRLVCPNGHAGFLDHDIDSSGRVSPSVECPDAACDFHESGVILEGWAGFG